ncbi:hypothetical protein CRENBAI_009878 [Crenichthys baileyi]|uniref:Uncharacterized protein n=1 Tax=Crenichthys baileyi TaxID=28760 RepID=A0AAV9SQ75_9TELE
MLQHQFLLGFTQTLWHSSPLEVSRTPKYQYSSGIVQILQSLSMQPSLRSKFQSSQGVQGWTASDPIFSIPRRSKDGPPLIHVFEFPGGSEGRSPLIQVPGPADCVPGPADCVPGPLTVFQAQLTVFQAQLTVFQALLTIFQCLPTISQGLLAVCQRLQTYSLTPRWQT